MASITVCDRCGVVIHTIHNKIETCNINCDRRFFELCSPCFEHVIKEAESK